MSRDPLGSLEPLEPQAQSKNKAGASKKVVVNSHKRQLDLYRQTLAAFQMENSNSDPSQGRGRVEDQPKIFEKAVPLVISTVMEAVGTLQSSMAIFTHFLSEELEKRSVQLETISKMAEKLAAQQQDIDELRDKVATLSQRLEREKAGEVRDQEVLNCGPAVPDKIEAQDRQPIERSTQTLKETEANPPATLSIPVACKQRPENGFQQPRETLLPNTRKPDCAKPCGCSSSPLLKPKDAQVCPPLLPRLGTSATDARLAGSSDHHYSSFTKLQRFQAILKTPYRLDLRNEPAREDLKPIVIDGSNVAFAHGLKKFFSCRGIAIAVEYFWKLGNRNITVFVPHWRTRWHANAREQHFLRQLEDLGLLAFTPSRDILGQRIASHEDRFLLHLAEKTGGIIVTNDNLREFVTQSVSWREIVSQRLLQYTFVGDIFMVADDPLGRHGPPLEEFLREEDCLGDMQPRPKAQASVGTVGLGCQSHSTQGCKPSCEEEAPSRLPRAPLGPGLPQQPHPTPLAILPRRQQHFPGLAHRTCAETVELREVLLNIFPDSEQKQKIDRILAANPSLKDPDALSVLVLDC